jgi:hypothetical protein
MKKLTARQGVVAVTISGKTRAIVAASGGTVAGLLIGESNKKRKYVSASNNKKCKCKKDKHGNEDYEEH